MRRVNISNDVNSRAQIASAVPQTPAVKPEEVVTSNTEEDGKTEEAQGGEDNTPTQAEPDTAPKRGRKTKGNTEKV